MPHKNPFFEADLAGLKDPSNWPLWPLLPVKRYPESHGRPTLGSVYANDKKPIIYIGANPFALGADPGLTPVENDTNGFQVLEMKSSMSESAKATVASQLAVFEKKEYASFEDMLNDGWVVD